MGRSFEVCSMDDESDRDVGRLFLFGKFVGERVDIQQLTYWLQFKRLVDGPPHHPCKPGMFKTPLRRGRQHFLGEMNRVPNSLQASLRQLDMFVFAHKRNLVWGNIYRINPKRLTIYSARSVIELRISDENSNVQI